MSPHAYPLLVDTSRLDHCYTIFLSDCLKSNEIFPLSKSLMCLFDIRTSIELNFQRSS